MNGRTSHPTARRIPAYAWILLAYVIAFPILFRPVLHGSDPLGYYAWVHSAIIDGDLNVDNEFTDLKFDSYFVAYTPTGYRVNHWSPGPGLLWSPTFAATHAVQLGLKSLGAPVSTDGYGWPYRTAAALASTLYALAGLLLIWDVARRFASEAAATLASIAIWFASPLVFYMYSHPFMSHAVDFFANALFIWVWYRTRSWNSAKGWFFRGLCIGLAVVVRSQNVTLVVFPALELVYDLAKGSDGEWAHRLWAAVKKGLAFGLGAVPFAVLQVSFWRIVYGQWYANPYLYQPGSEGGIFDFTRLRLYFWTFSTSNGLFFWSPLLLFGLAGLFILFGRDRRLALLLMTTWSLQLLLLSVIIYTGAQSFGARLLVDTLPVFILGLAALIDWMRKYVSLRVLAAVTACFIVWNMLLIVQYVMGTIPRVGPVDVESLIRNQFTVIPENIQRIIHALIERAHEP